MGTSQKPVDRGSRRGREACAALGRQLRDARRANGLSQESVGRAVGLSPMHVSRIERGMVQTLSLVQASRLAAVLGLDLSIKAYPIGDAIRDEAHRALLDRTIATIGPSLRWRHEVPLPLTGDLRAWDLGLELGNELVAFEGETHVSDLQALQRKIRLRCRDDPRVKAVVLVLGDTRHHRRLIRDHRDALALDFPLTADSLMPLLRAGGLPRSNGWLIL